MYLQVRVRQEDQCAQRLLWRKEMFRTKEPDVYQIEGVFSGLITAVFLNKKIRPSCSLGIFKFQDHYLTVYFWMGEEH